MADLAKPSTVDGYVALWGWLEDLRERSEEHWIEAMRTLCREDLYFLMRFVLSTRDWYTDKAKTVHRLDHPFIMARCREIEEETHNVLDAWSREHLKSTIKTFANLIRYILIDPNVTICILSHNRPSAKKFLRKIKIELETNKVLLGLFPDILYADPEMQAAKWSENDGLMVKRSANVVECTVEAWGMIEGLPTGSHFQVLNVDDAINERAVTSSEQISKVTSQWELLQSIGREGGIIEYTGTFYSASDTYSVMIERGVKLRRIPAVDDNGKSVFYSEAYIEERRSKMSPATWGLQWLVDPRAGAATRFDLAWINFYDPREEDPFAIRDRGNCYILVDPASGKKKSDYTAMWVVVCMADETVWAVDVIRDRLDVTGRVDRVFELVRIWRPNEVRVEEYGLQNDTQLLEKEMERQKFRFNLISVGGLQAKVDRIDSRLSPLFRGRRFYLPNSLPQRRADGTDYDPCREFMLEEYGLWPQPKHEDLLDSLSRLFEPNNPPNWPLNLRSERERLIDGRWDRKRRNDGEGASWLSAM